MISNLKSWVLGGITLWRDSLLEVDFAKRRTTKLYTWMLIGSYLNRKRWNGRTLKLEPLYMYKCPYIYMISKLYVTSWKHVVSAKSSMQASIHALFAYRILTSLMGSKDSKFKCKWMYYTWVYSTSPPHHEPQFCQWFNHNSMFHHFCGQNHDSMISIVVYTISTSRTSWRTRPRKEQDFPLNIPLKWVLNT